jgi:hypothetical protein
MQSLDSFVHISEPVKDAAGVAVGRQQRDQRVHWLTAESGVRVQDMLLIGLPWMPLEDSQLALWRRMSVARVFFLALAGRLLMSMSHCSMEPFLNPSADI